MNEEELNKLRALANSEDNALPESDEEEGTDTPSEDSQTKEEVEEDAADDTEKDKEEPEEIPRVPYSRFETVNERAIKAEQELQLLKTQLEQTARESKPFTGDLPSEWVELFGDTEPSRKLYEVEQKRIAKMHDEVSATAVEKAVEKLQTLQQEQQSREAEIVGEMENAFTDYSAKNKRTFTDGEQSAILDIMDDLTPKDDKGNYIVPPVSYLSKAVQWYDMQTAQASSGKKESRKKATSVVDASTEGEPQGKGNEAHFRAGDWDSWRNNPLLN